MIFSRGNASCLLKGSGLSAFSRLSYREQGRFIQGWLHVFLGSQLLPLAVVVRAHVLKAIYEESSSALFLFYNMLIGFRAV